ncbi:3-deoxy-8-phosphooctulonate synthase [candidate division KSB1 bacterium]|nr:3-deoxy-8-phosphooctulonate synthase [candidate division KSB1 bacterium]
MSESFKIGNISVGLDEQFFIIAGPCVIESFTVCMEIAHTLAKIQQETGIPFAFKASFDKANRSSIDSFRGPGLDEGLATLDKVRLQSHLPVVTDIHEAAQAAPAGGVVDCLQIPAFLCRQTDLLVACGKTNKPVNVKKGQFTSPEEMKNAVGKIQSTGNSKILLTDRGTFFGYNRLVNDMTCIPKMQALGCPVVFDGTHSTQQPGGLGSASGGRKDMAPVLSRAAVAAGANALFLEVHPNPSEALCDAECMLPLEQVKDLAVQCKEIFEIIRR